MLPKMLQLKSGGYGPDVTMADSLKAAAVTMGGALALVAVLTVAIKLYGKNPYFESLLKGRPAGVQAVLIGGPAVIVIAIALGSAWINSN